MKYTLLIAVFVAICASFIASQQSTTVSSHSIPSMRGLCWVAGDSVSTHNIQQIVDIGANWISQTPFGWMKEYNSTEVVLNNKRAWWGETDRGIKHTATLAHEANVKTILKPHIWLHRGESGKFRADIEMDNEEAWDQWFLSYGNWIKHYAKLAEESNIEVLCIGTELHQTVKRTKEWRSLIQDIRAIYSGQITYAANWYQEFEDVAFWDDLDFIGIQGYFPLSNDTPPTKKELIKGWKKPKAKLKKIAKQYNKKVVFTEIGYKNTADAAKEPWTWPQDMDESVVISDETQEICYEALFESLWEEPWFDGLYIWKWFHSTYKHETFDTYFESRDKRRKEWAKKRNRKSRPPVYFSPQRTETMNILKERYLQKAAQ